MAKLRNPRYAHRTRPSTIVPRLAIEIPPKSSEMVFFNTFYGDENEILEGNLSDSSSNEDIPKIPKRCKVKGKKRTKKFPESPECSESGESSYSDSENIENVASHETVSENEIDVLSRQLNEQLENEADFSLYFEDADGNRLVEIDGKLVLATDEAAKQREATRKERRAELEKKIEELNKKKSDFKKKHSSVPPPIEEINQNNEPLLITPPPAPPMPRTAKSSRRTNAEKTQDLLQCFRMSIKRMSVVQPQSARRTIICPPSRLAPSIFQDDQMMENHDLVSPHQDDEIRRKSLHPPALSPIRRHSKQFSDSPINRYTRLSRMWPQMCSTPVINKSSGKRDLPGKLEDLSPLQQEDKTQVSDSETYAVPSFENIANYLIVEEEQHTKEGSGPTLPEVSPSSRSRRISKSLRHSKNANTFSNTSKSDSFEETQQSSSSNASKTYDEKSHTSEITFKEPTIGSSFLLPKRRSVERKSIPKTVPESLKKRRVSEKSLGNEENSIPENKSSNAAVADHTFEELRESKDYEKTEPRETVTDERDIENLLSDMSEIPAPNFTFGTNQNTLMFGESDIMHATTMNAYALNNITNMTVTSEYGRNAANQTKRNITLMRADATMDGSIIIPTVPFYLEDFNGESSPLAHLLHVIGQEEIISWSKLPKDVLKNPIKLGEGAYGEVFKSNFDGQPTALKIMPISAEGGENRVVVNGEFIFSAEEVLPELLITKELSTLNNMKNNFATPNFIQLLNAKIVKGKYPGSLLKAFDTFAKKDGTYNDRPSEYDSPEQLFLIIGLSLGGADLEKQTISNEKQFVSIFFQMLLSIMISEKTLEFEHRDLHLGNILLEKCNTKEKLKYKFDNNDFCLCTHGVKINIIDFTLSRMKRDGITLYKDLEQDPELFTGKDNYQFDVYRMMRKNCEGDWAKFEPKSNLYWLHHLAHELLSKPEMSKISKKRRMELMKEMDTLLDLDSATDVLTNENFSWMVQGVLEKA